MDNALQLKHSGPRNDIASVEEVDGLPYFSSHHYHPGVGALQTASHVGQRVIIDWAKGDARYHKMNEHGQKKSFRPENTPDQREFEITEIIHETYFKGFTVDSVERKIIEICWDSRGGYCEVIDGTWYSHPILTFQK